MRTGIRGLALGITAAALLAGCGNDDSQIEPISSSTTTTTSGDISQEEFITEADSRCREANAALANLSSDSAAVSTAGQERSITQGLVRGLQALGDPEDPDGSLQDYYSAVNDQVRVLKQQEQAIASGDTASADALDTDLSTAKSEAADAAQQYGFQDCGQEGTTLPDTTTPSSSSGSVTTTPSATTPTTATPTPTPAPTPTPTPVTPAPPSTGGTGTGGGTTPPSTGGTGTGGSSSGSGGITP